MGCRWAISCRRDRNDVTTLEEIVERIERLYGKAQRIWVLDRGLVSEENLRFLKQAGAYLVGTPKGLLKRFEGELRAQDWQPVREVWRCGSVRPRW